MKMSQSDNSTMSPRTQLIRNIILHRLVSWRTPKAGLAEGQLENHILKVDQHNFGQKAKTDLSHKTSFAILLPLQQSCFDRY